MIGDKILIRPHHRQASSAVADILADRMEPEARYAVSVAGESGAGKSEIGTALGEALTQRGLGVTLLHQDDYFVYPPKTNHRFRVQDIRHVGPGEVRLDKMNRDVEEFLAGASVLHKPLANYDTDRVEPEDLEVSGARVLIAEGTYTTLLEAVQLHVFIDRDHHDTCSDRIARGRDAVDDFAGRVLEIEHRIISAHRDRAHVIVGKDFSVRGHRNL